MKADWLSIPEVAELVPGGRHPSTVNRWITVGVSGIRLAAQRIGGRYVVSREAVEQFLSALNS